MRCSSTQGTSNQRSAVQMFSLQPTSLHSRPIKPPDFLPPIPPNRLQCYRPPLVPEGSRIFPTGNSNLWNDKPAFYPLFSLVYLCLSSRDATSSFGVNALQSPFWNSDLMTFFQRIGGRSLDYKIFSDSHRNAHRITVLTPTKVPIPSPPSSCAKLYALDSPT